MQKAPVIPPSATRSGTYGQIPSDWGDIYDILLTNSSPDTNENFSFICALVYMLRLDV